MAFLSDILSYAYGARVGRRHRSIRFLADPVHAAVAGLTSDRAAEFERRMRAAGMGARTGESRHRASRKRRNRRSRPRSRPSPPPRRARAPRGTARAENDQRAAPLRSGEEAGGGRAHGETMIGGVSPAIVYLQNLKMQIEHFEKGDPAAQGMSRASSRSTTASILTFSSAWETCKARCISRAPRRPRPAPRPPRRVRAPRGTARAENDRRAAPKRRRRAGSASAPGS